jgi:two-component system NtrC family sensor kinase
MDDGRVFAATATPIAGVGQVVVLHDITHLKKLDQIKSDFVATVSHDLRSPLTAILGYAELIGRAGPVNAQQADFIGRITNSVQAITSLISDLLDLGRIEAGFDAQKEATHLPLVVRYAVEGLRQAAVEKGVELAVEVPDSLPSVWANPPRLRQMLANLIDNAVKFTPAGGLVQVRAQCEDGQVVIRVRDSGIGIPAAEQQYVFDRFFRASNSQPASSGAGLGLTIVKSIVEDHGGRVWLESAPETGTTFSVVLPAGATAAP